MNIQQQKGIENIQLQKEKCTKYTLTKMYREYTVTKRNVQRIYIYKSVQRQGYTFSSTGHPYISTADVAGIQVVFFGSNCNFQNSVESEDPKRWKRTANGPSKWWRAANRTTKWWKRAANGTSKQRKRTANGTSKRWKTSKIEANERKRDIKIADIYNLLFKTFYKVIKKLQMILRES